STCSWPRSRPKRRRAARGGSRGWSCPRARCSHATAAPSAPRPSRALPAGWRAPCGPPPTRRRARRGGWARAGAPPRRRSSATARVRQHAERLNISGVTAAESDPSAVDGRPEPLREAVAEVEAEAALRRPELTRGNGNGNGNGKGYNGQAAAPPSPPQQLLVR